MAYNSVWHVVSAIWVLGGIIIIAIIAIPLCDADKSALSAPHLSS